MWKMNLHLHGRLHSAVLFILAAVAFAVLPPQARAEDTLRPEVGKPLQAAQTPAPASVFASPPPPAYVTPETAQGTGPYPAIMVADPGLPTHTLYRPANLAALGAAKLPIVAFANGACANLGNPFRYFLSEIASHGFLAIAVGPIGAKEVEFSRSFAGEQPAAGSPAAGLAARGQLLSRAAESGPSPAAFTTARQLIDAIDWAQAENARPGSPYQGRLATEQIAVMGMSCGGLQALDAAHDPRVKTLGVWNSGTYDDDKRALEIAGAKVSKADLKTLRTPAIYITGDPSDVAFANTEDDFSRIEGLPLFRAWREKTGHGGTYREPNGGEFGEVAVGWLLWQLKGDREAAKLFVGTDCGICRRTGWHVKKKHIDPGIARESRYVPVRDGTRLAVNIYRPAVAGNETTARLPVVFAFTPYRARYRDASGTVVELGLSDRLGLKSLTDHGYVIAVADIRGKGASFGARRGFQDRTEALDGHDLVEWLAHQPWSTGKVGMIGCSYLGGATLQTASTAPPSLKAIFVGAADLDKYAFVRRGGIPAQFNTRPDEPLSDDLMSLPMDADGDGALLRAAVAGHAKNTPMAPLWYGMPYRDSVSSYTGNRFWEEVGPYTYLDTLKKSGIASYFWGNWQDEPTEQMLFAAANLGGKLLVGPGSHCVPPPGFDFSGEIRRYFDHHLKGIDNGIEREPRVTYWVDHAPKGEPWRRSDALPGVGVKRSSWYLSAKKSGSLPSANDGSLSLRLPARGKDTFTVNYDLGSGEYFNFWVDAMDDKGLTYTSPTLTADLTMVGIPLLYLNLAADRNDANVFAYLEDVDPAGKATVVSFGRLAASQRKISPAPYDTLGLPWHSGRSSDAQPLVPGKFVSLSFDLTPSARVFTAGHRLRLSITGADPRQRNLKEIRQDPPPRLTLAVGGFAPARLELPLLESAAR